MISPKLCCFASKKKEDSDIRESILFSGRLERDPAAHGGGEEDAYLGGVPDPHEVAADQVGGEVAQKDP